MFVLFASWLAFRLGLRAALTADSWREITNKLTDDLTIDFVTSFTELGTRDPGLGRTGHPDHHERWSTLALNECN